MHKPLLRLGVALLAVSAQAQSPLTYEAGVAAHATTFTSITTLDNGFGVCVNVGTFFLRRLSVDLSTELAPTVICAGTKVAPMEGGSSTVTFAVPVIPLPVSVAVSVWFPAVTKVTALLNV